MAKGKKGKAAATAPAPVKAPKATAPATKKAVAAAGAGSSSKAAAIVGAAAAAVGGGGKDDGDDPAAGMDSEVFIRGVVSCNHNLRVAVVSQVKRTQ